VTDGVSIGLAWRQVRDRFREAKVGTPELDARLIAQIAFDVDSMGLIRKERETASEIALTNLEQLALRRLAGEPISRIVGRREFWGLDFASMRPRSIPAPRPKCWPRKASPSCRANARPACSTSAPARAPSRSRSFQAFAKAKAIATDISDDALAVARQNAERHGVAARIEFRKGPWWQAVPHTELFDLIVSNPPYIATAEIDLLAPEVRVFDPKAALDGGWDGLDAYRAIASQAARRLNPGGMLLLEIGHNQADIVGKMLARAGFGRVEIRKDLAGLDRVISASHS